MMELCKMHTFYKHPGNLALLDRGVPLFEKIPQLGKSQFVVTFNCSGCSPKHEFSGKYEEFEENMKNNMGPGSLCLAAPLLRTA